MHTLYFPVFWVSWIQIGCSMRVVYASVWSSVIPVSRCVDVSVYPGGGGHLYFRLDIILVKGLSKHTLNTYFSGVKLYPKYVFLQAFFLILSIMSFPKFVNTCMTKNTPFFPILHVFAPLNDVRTLPGPENNPNYVNFFTRMISNFKYKWPPPPPPPGCVLQLPALCALLSVCVVHYKIPLFSLSLWWNIASL